MKFIFFILSCIIYLIYPNFIYKPKKHLTKKDAEFIALINGVVCYFILNVLYVFLSAYFATGATLIIGFGITDAINVYVLRRKYVKIEDERVTISFNPIFQGGSVPKKFDITESLVAAEVKQQEKGNLYFKYGDKVYSKDKYVYERTNRLKKCHVNELKFYKKKIKLHIQKNKSTALLVSEIEAIDRILDEN